MNAKNLNIVRVFLIVMVFVLLGLTAVIYLTNRQFNVSTFDIAMGCLVIYLVT